MTKNPFDITDEWIREFNERAGHIDQVNEVAGEIQHNLESWRHWNIPRWQAFALAKTCLLESGLVTVSAWREGLIALVHSFAISKEECNEWA